MFMGCDDLCLKGEVHWQWPTLQKKTTKRQSQNACSRGENGNCEAGGREVGGSVFRNIGLLAADWMGGGCLLLKGPMEHALDIEAALRCDNLRLLLRFGGVVAAPKRGDVPPGICGALLALWWWHRHATGAEIVIWPVNDAVDRGRREGDGGNDGGGSKERHEF